jgi:hypothetical protein
LQIPLHQGVTGFSGRERRRRGWIASFFCPLFKIVRQSRELICKLFCENSWEGECGRLGFEVSRVRESVPRGARFFYSLFTLEDRGARLLPHLDGLFASVRPFFICTSGGFAHLIEWGGAPGWKAALTNGIAKSSCSLRGSERFFRWTATKARKRCLRR